ncbi:MAG: esterase-like activity of phytase family protein [Rhodobacteraceae bacterium]|nr:esterase-like activity of phytase family protein [Paracoccaceae bacterium]
MPRRRLHSFRMPAVLLSIFVVLVPGLARAAELLPLGTYDWSEPDDEFGGFSALVIAADGGSFYAASDRGELYRATVNRDGSGKIASVRGIWHDRFQGNRGKPVSGFTADAEAMATDREGRLVVAFESYARIAAYSPPDMMPVALSSWDRFKAIWGNEGFESLLVLPDDRLMVIVEAQSNGGYPTYIEEGGEWQAGPPLPVPDDFHAVDATIGPDGKVYLLERRHSLITGYQSRVRRLALPDDGVWRDAADELLLTRPGELDNMEGIGLWRTSGGRTIVTLISDDNFSPFQRTIIAEYELNE